MLYLPQEDTKQSQLSSQCTICCHAIRRLWLPWSMCNDGRLCTPADSSALTANKYIRCRKERQVRC